MRFGRVLLLIVMTSAPVALGACGSSSTTNGSPNPPSATGAPATTATSVPAGSAPCTEAAIVDGVASQDASATAVSEFACIGQWAYAITSGRKLLLEANGPRWSVVDTATACAAATIPAAVKTAAC